MREDLTEVEEILSSSLFLVVGTPNSIETVFNEAVGSFFLTPECSDCEVASSSSEPRLLSAQCAVCTDLGKPCYL